MKQRYLALLFGLVSMLLLAACGDTATVPAAATVQATTVAQSTPTIAPTTRLATATTVATTKAVVTTAAPTTAAATPTVVAKVGQPIPSNGYILTINSFEKADTSGPYITPKAGNTFAILDITIESAKDKGVNVNPFYGKIRDSKGYSYTSTVGKTPALDYTNDLPAGQKLRGWVTYEIPKDATELVYEYAPPVIGAKIVISVPLG
jgi:hypothetical protein